MGFLYFCSSVLAGWPHGGRRVDGCPWLSVMEFCLLGLCIQRVTLTCYVPAFPCDFPPGLGVLCCAFDEGRASSECRRRSGIHCDRPTLSECLLHELSYGRKSGRAAGPAAVLLGRVGRTGFREVGSRARETGRAPDAASAGEAAVRTRAAGHRQLDRGHLEERDAPE